MSMHSKMGVTTQFLDNDTVLGSRYTLPQEVRGSEVTEAALHISSNFLEEIARVTPRSATMKEKTETSTTQLRRSARFMDPRDSLRQAQISTPPPIVSTVPTKSNAHKV